MGNSNEKVNVLGAALDSELTDDQETEDVAELVDDVDREDEEDAEDDDRSRPKPASIERAFLMTGRSARSFPVARRMFANAERNVGRECAAGSEVVYSGMTASS